MSPPPLSSHPIASAAAVVLMLLALCGPRPAVAAAHLSQSEQPQQPSRALPQKVQASRSVSLAMPRYLNDLDLSATQREKVFSILIELTPILRAIEAEIRTSQEALDGLVTVPHFDDAAAHEISASIARSVAALVLLRARGEHRILGQLSPEQRDFVENLRRPTADTRDETDVDAPTEPARGRMPQ